MTLPLLEDAPRALDAIIIGAGVTGLSIGLELVKRGYKIAFVAKDLPEDDQSPGFASPWAVGFLSLLTSSLHYCILMCVGRSQGCNWCSFAGEEKMDLTWKDKARWKDLRVEANIYSTYTVTDNNKREQEWDRKTYQALFKVAEEYPDLCEVSTLDK